MDWNGKPYHSLDYMLKERFGEKIYKVSLNGGMSCPNRDGTLDYRGCIFCSAGGSGDFAASRSLSVTEQIESQKALLEKKRPAGKYIAYFQAYTNTYAPVEHLEALFTEALAHPDIVGLSIGTRPDCLGSDVLMLLEKLQRKAPLWVELGLQTIHADTARYIRRGYELPCFEEAVLNLRRIGAEVVVHTILGLPQENPDMIYATMDYLNHRDIQGIKLQLLHVLKGTDLAADYEKGLFQVYSMEEYFEVLIGCLERLRPNMVIHRITGDGPKALLIAPAWSSNKRTVLNTLHRELRLRNTWQGKLYNQL